VPRSGVKSKIKPPSDLSYGLFEFAARAAGFSQLGIMEQLLGPDAAARSARGHQALAGGPKVKTKTPKTLKDLIDHNVRFLRGELSESPNHLGPVDKETEPYLGPLIGINLLGPFLTTNSQPGLVKGSLRQRSYLTGLAPRRVAEKLHTRLNAIDLILNVHAVPTDADEIVHHNAILSGAVTVTRDGKRDHTFVGHYCDDFSHWERLMPVAARRKVAEDLCEVTGIDPVWGRDPMDEKGLFTAFMRALGGGKVG